MKFTVSMKDPDALDESIETSTQDTHIEGADEDEIDMIREHRAGEIRKLCCKNWFKHGEYLRVEIDTEAKTCTVLPVN